MRGGCGSSANGVRPARKFRRRVHVDGPQGLRKPDGGQRPVHRSGVLAVTLLLSVASSGCLSELFGRDGCPAVLMGNPRDASALLRICDYAFQLDDPEDAIIVKALGTTPDSWQSHHLDWEDIAIDARNTSLRVAFQSRADATTGIDVPVGSPQTLAALKDGPIELDELITFCEIDSRDHEVRFRLYQAAQDKWDSAGGMIEIVWNDVRDC